MSGLLGDLRHAQRVFARNPGFTAVVVITLTLGIGVTTAVFSIFNGVLLRPLPFPDAQELVLIYNTFPACNTCPASFPKYHDWRARNQVFAAMGGSAPTSFTLTGSGEATRISAMQTTASLLDVLRVQPKIGRWYTEQEDQPGGPKVAVLAHGLWTQQFNADPAILGRKVILNGEPYEVIGVMPEVFAHRRGQVFVPLQRKLDPATRGNHFMSVYARLKKGVPLERAIQDMRNIGHDLAREFGSNHGVDAQSYKEAVVGSVRAPLNLLLGAVFCLLLIACANVANLLLASGLARRRELAVRLALGAGPRELARQLATESVLLSAVGGALGILLAQWVVGVFVVLAGDQLPRATAIEMDWSVVAFAAIVSLGVGLLCSVWPIVLLCRADLAAAVREGDIRTGTQAGKKIGDGLVVAEVALAFALLVGSGLLVKNLVLLHNRDAGIRTGKIVAFDVAPTGPRYDSDAANVAFYREFYSRLAQVNSIESAGLISHLPMYNFGMNGEFRVEGEVPWDAKSAPSVEYRWYYGGYMKTMGVPLLKGRWLDQRDGAKTQTVLVNKTMADKFWPGKDPIGRKFGQNSDVKTWFEVVGVIGDIRSYGLARRSPYEFYRSIEQSAFGGMTVVLRSKSDDPMSVIPAARQILAAIDPALPITKVQTMEAVVGESVGQPRLMSALTGLFGGLAGLLAMVGIYSVMAYNVRRQRREFGVRIALGANRADVSKLVINRGLVLTALGVSIGAGGAWFLTRLVATMLNDVKPTDPAVFAGTAVAVLVVGLLASYLPAHTASRVDPMIVLRTE